MKNINRKTNLILNISILSILVLALFVLMPTEVLAQDPVKAEMYLGDYEISKEKVGTSFVNKEVKYIETGSGKIIKERTSSSNTWKMNYYHTNHQGSTSVVTNNQGQKDTEFSSGRLRYFPYGEQITKQDVNSLVVDDTYTGQKRDTESDLMFYNARLYNQKTGLFMQADSVNDGLNRYTYVSGNPVNIIDPNGNTGVSQTNNPSDFVNQYMENLKQLGNIRYIDPGFFWWTFDPNTAISNYEEGYGKAMGNNFGPNSYVNLQDNSTLTKFFSNLNGAGLDSNKDTLDRIREAGSQYLSDNNNRTFRGACIGSSIDTFMIISGLGEQAVFLDVIDQRGERPSNNHSVVGFMYQDELYIVDNYKYIAGQEPADYDRQSMVLPANEYVSYFNDRFNTNVLGFSIPIDGDPYDIGGSIGKDWIITAPRKQNRFFDLDIMKNIETNRLWNKNKKMAQNRDNQKFE